MRGFGVKLMEEGRGQNRNRIWLSPDTLRVGDSETGHPHDEGETARSRAARSAVRFLKSVIDKYVVVVCASIRVEYRGRASSAAAESVRLVITKPDGTLIIHEDTKHRPLNWQPPGTKFHLSIEDGSVLTLKALRKKDSERVTIWFERIFYIAASMITPGDFRLSGSESEMVDLVVRDPGLIEEGFLPQKREFRTKYGNVDLIGRDRDGCMVVLEFKRRQAQLSSASQLDRYVQHLADTEELQPAGKLGHEGRRKIRAGIVAPAITPEALELLRNRGYEFFRLEPRLDAPLSKPRITSPKRITTTDSM